MYVFTSPPLNPPNPTTSQQKGSVTGVHPKSNVTRSVLSPFPFFPFLPTHQLTPPLPLAALPLRMLRPPLPLRRHHRRDDVHPPLPTNARHANGICKEQAEFCEDCEFVDGLDAFYWIDYVVCVFLFIFSSFQTFLFLSFFLIVMYIDTGSSQGFGCCVRAYGKLHQFVFLFSFRVNSTSVYPTPGHIHCAGSLPCSGEQ